MNFVKKPQKNQLLSAPSTVVRERTSPYLELVSLALGRFLYEPGDIMSHAYFLTDSIVSLLS